MVRVPVGARKQFGRVWLWKRATSGEVLPVMGAIWCDASSSTDAFDGDKLIVYNSGACRHETEAIRVDNGEKMTHDDGEQILFDLGFG